MKVVSSTPRERRDPTLCR